MAGNQGNQTEIRPLQTEFFVLWFVRTATISGGQGTDTPTSDSS
jgi:hypothetical protein